MIRRHRLIAVEGDGKRVTRTAHQYPAEVRVYAGGPETRPSTEMGGPSMCPSVLLLVQPDGSYELWEVNGTDRTLKTEGQLREYP